MSSSGLIADQSREVANIIEDLLVAARADTGTLDINLGVVDLRDLVGIELVGGGFAESLRQGNLTIEMLEAPAWGDTTRVRQIIRNLLTNALRYGGDRVRVSSGVSEGIARIGVADSGIGIPIQDQDRIFEPYQRAHDRPTQPGSVGLGLTVARQLARLMAGTSPTAMRAARASSSSLFPPLRRAGTSPTSPTRTAVSPSELVGAHRGRDRVLCWEQWARPPRALHTAGGGGDVEVRYHQAAGVAEIARVAAGSSFLTTGEGSRTRDDRRRSRSCRGIAPSRSTRRGRWG